MAEKINLYRVENPNIPVSPLVEVPGGTSHPDIRGQWFSPRLDKALNYLPKATQYKPEGTGLRPLQPKDGAVLHIAEVDADQLDSYLASAHPTVQSMEMDFEPLEDYILPRDSIVSTLPLDELVGESRGKMNRFDERQKAIERVRGGLALHLSQIDRPKAD